MHQKCCIFLPKVSIRYAPWYELHIELHGFVTMVVFGFQTSSILDNLVLSIELIMWIGHRKEIQKVMFRALALRRSESVIAICSDEGLALKTSASESLYGGQFTLSTQLIKPNYLVILPLTPHNSFFRNLPPLLPYIKLFLVTFDIPFWYLPVVPPLHDSQHINMLGQVCGLECFLSWKSQNTDIWLAWTRVCCQGNIIFL